ncbi:MAG TPA: hypothetical protein VFM38_00755 [Candidatus Limnocylindrales bacterium]|nr:hypothetical protein [Candidatus Limnocylindrales bacterium]
MTDTVKWLKTRPTVSIVRVLGVVVLGSFALSGYTVVKQSQAAAERAADRKAANTAQVARCYQQVRDSPDVLKILGLIDTLARNSIATNRAALEVSADNDPLRPVREASLARLVPAERTLGRFIGRAAAQVPSPRDCNQLAAQLHVDPAPLRKAP